MGRQVQHRNLDRAYPRIAQAGRPGERRLASAAALFAFVAGHLAFLGFSLAVFANEWFDPLVKASRGLLTDTLLVNLLGLVVVVGGVIFGLARLRPADVGWRWSDLPQASLVLAIVWLATQAIAAALAMATTGTLSPHPLWAQRGVLGVLGLLLAQLVGNALFEEIGYRGFLFSQFAVRLRGIKDSRLRVTLAAALSLAIFAVMHLPNRVGQGYAGRDLALLILIALALGTLLLLLYLRTKNLPLVVGIHALMNAPTLLVAAPISNEIVEILAILLLVAWRDRTDRALGW